MDSQTIGRIKNMSEYLSVESIASALNMPQDVVTAVLRGEIEAATEAPRTSPAKIQVVEKARFVRNKTITAISPGGGTGKTTLLVSLATAAAINNPSRRPVAIMDLAEISKTVTALGYNYLELATDPNVHCPTLFNSDKNYWSKDLSAYTIKHPALDTLFIAPGAVIADMNKDIDKNTFVETITQFQKEFEITFIDLPTGFTANEEMLVICDSILIVISPNRSSIEGLFQLLPSLVRLNLLEKSYIVINQLGLKGQLDISECRNIVKYMAKQSYSAAKPEQLEIIGALPECPEIMEHINKCDGDNVMLNGLDSEYAKEINYILSQLCPDWQSSKQKKASGITNILGRLLNR